MELLAIGSIFALEAGICLFHARSHLGWGMLYLPAIVQIWGTTGLVGPAIGLTSVVLLELQKIYWEHPWWRRLWIPSMGHSDLWHLLSALSHYPLSGYLLWLYVDPGAYHWRWGAISVGVFIMWQVIKKLHRKNWPSGPAQVWKGLKGW